MEPTTIVMDDLDYTATLNPSPGATGSEGEPLSVEFELIEGIGSDIVPLRLTTNAIGEVIASGFVKWDGCVNWSSDKTCMNHACERSDLTGFGEALARIREAALRAMKQEEHL